MKFTLVYEGSLPSGGNNSKHSRHKWEIRNCIHPQLATLFQRHAVLIQMLEADNENRRLGQPSQVQFKKVRVGNHDYVPLCNQYLNFVCSLDILFLRPEAPGALITQGGDLDNRIKVLFDALRMPTQGENPPADLTVPDPMYCLLESDTLITRFSIRTDQLLTEGPSGTSHVKLIIEVSTHPLAITWGNISLLAD